MQSRTRGDTTNHIVAALRVVLVGIRIFKLEFKIGPPKKNDLTRVCLRSHNSAKKQRNRRFSCTTWDMSVDVKLLVGKKTTREPGNQGTGVLRNYFSKWIFGGKPAKLGFA